MDGSFYAFTVADGVTCVMSRSTGGYGCSGAIPAAPEGANTGQRRSGRAHPDSPAPQRPMYAGVDSGRQAAARGLADQLPQRVAAAPTAP